ncbi:hypothetical protein BREVNS_2399 [Brevinematales bacterium NS]|jgi:hypothetical protein|nr:hypothetical protein BREVNS_2399 [Brevinematales bacterium NS]
MCKGLKKVIENRKWYKNIPFHNKQAYFLDEKRHISLCKQKKRGFRGVAPDPEREKILVQGSRTNVFFHVSTKVTGWLTKANTPPSFLQKNTFFATIKRQKKESGDVYGFSAG